MNVLWLSANKFLFFSNIFDSMLLPCFSFTDYCAIISYQIALCPLLLVIVILSSTKHMTTITSILFCENCFQGPSPKSPACRLWTDFALYGLALNMDAWTDTLISVFFFCVIYWGNRNNTRIFTRLIDWVYLKIIILEWSGLFCREWTYIEINICSCFTSNKNN